MSNFFQSMNGRKTSNSALSTSLTASFQESKISSEKKDETGVSHATFRIPKVSGNTISDVTFKTKPQQNQIKIQTGITIEDLISAYHYANDVNKEIFKIILFNLPIHSEKIHSVFLDQVFTPFYELPDNYSSDSSISIDEHELKINSLSVILNQSKLKAGKHQIFPFGENKLYRNAISTSQNYNLKIQPFMTSESPVSLLEPFDWNNSLNKIIMNFEESEGFEISNSRFEEENFNLDPNLLGYELYNDYHDELTVIFGLTGATQFEINEYLNLNSSENPELRKNIYQCVRNSKKHVSEKLEELFINSGIDYNDVDDKVKSTYLIFENHFKKLTLRTVNKIKFIHSKLPPSIQQQDIESNFNISSNILTQLKTLENQNSENNNFITVSATLNQDGILEFNIDQDLNALFFGFFI